MEILVKGYTPKIDPATGQHASYQIAGVTYYPYVMTYTINGQTFTGEATSKSLSPRWQPGERWDANIVPDEKAAGGQRLKSFNKINQHVGGSSYPRQSNTGTPNFPPEAQTPTFPPEAQIPNYPPSPPANPTPRDKDNFKQSLIIAQSSMKVALEYIIHLSEIEKNAMMDLLKQKDENAKETDMIPKYALKIARETVKVANDILPSL
jgi:hypothetical protein